jgi:hypothetical protein
VAFVFGGCAFRLLIYVSDRCREAGNVERSNPKRIVPNMHLDLNSAFSVAPIDQKTAQKTLQCFIDCLRSIARARDIFDPGREPAARLPYKHSNGLNVYHPRAANATYCKS